MVTVKEKWEEIEASCQRIRLGGGAEEIEKVHQKGKFTARERIERLFDPDTFQEIDLLKGAYITGFDIDEVEIPGDGVITGYGEVNGRFVYVWAQDATVFGGTMAANHIRKIVSVMEKALREKVPIVGIYDSEGMRIQDVVHSHGHFTPGSMMYFQTLSSGVIPQISLVMGSCKGIAAISARLADFVFMVKGTSYMHATPLSSDSGASTKTSSETMGDPAMHSKWSGCCDVLTDNEAECLVECKSLLSFLPNNNEEKVPVVDTGDDAERTIEDIMDVVPADPNKIFDMREVIKRVVDNGVYFEVGGEYARNLTTGFARFDGKTGGIIANNTIWRAGCMDVDTSGKHARFTRFCDAFNIPLIYFSDCPAFFPSGEEERKGVLRHGCMVIQATCEATVPKINVIVRKLYGGACLVMPVNFTKADKYVAWPGVERGVMGAPGLARIVTLGKIKRAKTEEEKEKIFKDGLKVMEERVKAHSIVTNEDIIDPRDTRKFIIEALRCTQLKKQERPPRKHENMNL
jgi:acetyl-CoA carboxylase carboxyltransferase component